MNPDTPLTPREALEVQLTALLMGELSPEEAAALETQMAGDPALAALHARLRQAVELLREASAIPEQPAPPVPVQMSSERRERLLAHFKGAAPAPAAVIVKPRWDWRSIVPLGLAASLIALLGGTVLMNGFGPRKIAFFGSPDFPTDAEGAAMSAPESRWMFWSSQPGAIRRYVRQEGEKVDAKTASEATRWDTRSDDFGAKWKEGAARGRDSSVARREARVATANEEQPPSGAVPGAMLGRMAGAKSAPPPPPAPAALASGPVSVAGALATTEPLSPAAAPVTATPAEPAAPITEPFLIRFRPLARWTCSNP
jgi:hypothetical protein